MDKIVRIVEESKQQGAKLETGGGRIGTKGFLVQPTVFSGVTDEMSCAVNEVNIRPSFLSSGICMQSAWEILSSLTVYIFDQTRPLSFLNYVLIFIYYIITVFQGVLLRRGKLNDLNTVKV